MRYAILDENRKVIQIVEADSPPPNSVKGHCATCKVGYIFSGVDFKPPVWTSYQFLNRFTPEERAAFRAEAITNPIVADFQMLAIAAQEIIADDPITIMGMNYLVSIGLLSEQRKNEILDIVV